MTPPEEPNSFIGVPRMSGGVGNPGSSLGLSTQDTNQTSIQIQTPEPSSPLAPSHLPQHLQGTIV